MRYSCITAVQCSCLLCCATFATGQKQESHGGCHGGSRRAEGSPVWRAHQAPARLVAFGSAKLLLADYCPNLEVSEALGKPPLLLFSSG